MPVLEITTMVGCPLRCTFCPQDELAGAYRRTAEKYLSLDNFRLVLSKLPRHVQIDFSGMAEPWANRDATSMLEHALNQGFRVAIYTTLHGMSVEDSEQVIELVTRNEDRLAQIVLHLPDDNMNMRGWRVSAEYLRVLSSFLSLRQAGGVGERVSVMTMDSSGNVHRSLRHMGLKLGPWRGVSRAGSLPEDRVRELKAVPAPRNDCAVSCASTPFYDHNVLLPNGDVVLCCMDYSLRHTLGNLFQQDYEEMFISPVLAKLRSENGKPSFSKCSICKSCDNAITYDLEGAAWVADGGLLGVGVAVRSYLAPSVKRAMAKRITWLNRS